MQQQRLFGVSDRVGGRMTTMMWMGAAVESTRYQVSTRKINGSCAVFERVCVRVRWKVGLKAQGKGQTSATQHNANVQVLLLEVFSTSLFLAH